MSTKKKDLNISITGRNLEQLTESKLEAFADSLPIVAVVDTFTNLVDRNVDRGI